jgi:hypothetical protein
MGASAVAKKGMSLLNYISLLQVFFGGAICTVSPSSSCKKPRCQQKSFSNTTSASTPIHANVPVAGLVKVLKIEWRAIK